ncbi:RHS repeat-associated core domain-containing protein [Anaerotruncus rubiinfantis]|uniref:RHS repeat-associated core domain-containing protein n=1 Tax=Anaerotruncus rubiinfantis TaxID=1720200 RepID=UPI000834C279|nr:RHS repeat-associated core domain-containing protein [Anaerotruncus rubiinfantis]
MSKIIEKDGWVLYHRSSKEMKQLQTASNEPATFSARASNATKPDAPTPPPEPAWNDPKNYNDAPFSIETGNEDVILNSGAVQLTYDDLVLPGRNGFDLKLTRQYDSAKANTEDVNLYYDDEDGDRWNSIVYRARWQSYRAEFYACIEDSFYRWKNKGNMLSDIEKSYGHDPDIVENDPDMFPDHQPYYEGYIWTVPAKSTVFLRTSKRPNDHFKKLYGLGYGWRFMLPSIEKVLTQDYRSRYKTFVHFENGLSLAINEDDNGFEEYPLKDYTISKANNAYTVSYKDGRKAFFNSSNQLTHMTDRFGNQISFAYDSTGRMNQITDSFGRMIRLELSGSTLMIKRQDTSEILFTYTVSSTGELLSTTDAENRTTGYVYNQQVLQTQMSRDETGDLPVNVTFVNLTAVNHPTGARTEYTYSSRNDVYPTPYEGKHGIFVLTGRKDLPAPTDTTNIVNERTYSYEVSEASKTEKDEDGEYLYGAQDWGAPYTSKATILSHKNASGTFEVKEVTTFKEDGFKDDEMIYHIVDGVEKRVEQHEYAFTDRLLTVQLDSYLNYDYADIYDKTNIWQRITRYTYSTDKKGNPTQITEEYPARTSCNQEKNFIYDTNFSIPVEQSVLTAEGKYTITRDTLRTETDGKGKVPELRRILEKVDGVESLKEKTQFTYDSNFRVASEKRFYGDNLENAAAFVETVYTYGSYTDEPATQQISGVTDIHGDLISSTNGNGIVKTSVVHDWFGRATSQTDPNGNTTATSYDGIGRVTLVTNPDETTKATVYDDAANKITVTDENGVSRRYEYTPLGKISKDYMLSPETLMVEYQYDHLERLVSQINYGPNSQALATTSYTYDLFDQVLTKHTVGTDVDMEETHTYNPSAGRATKLERILTIGDTNAPTVTKFILKDPMDRVVTEQLGDLVTSYEYDRAGNQILKLDPRGYYTQWEYDYAGRVVRERNAVGNSIYTTYDALGRKVKARDYIGSDSFFTYDAAGRLIQQETPFNDEANAITRYFYDAAGNVVKQAVLISEPWYEMGYNDEWRETQYIYDSRGRVIDTIQYDDRADQEIRTRFAYDGVGNKVSQYTGMLGDSITGAALTSYTYNRFGAVLTMTDPMNQTETCAYDSIGRLTSKTDRNGNVTVYTYDAAGRLLTETVTVNNVASTITHAYTKTGQKRSEQNGTLTITYQYDAMGRMVQQTESDGTIKAYQYDENGNRTQFFLVRGGVEELNQTYIYDQLNRLVEMGSDNVTVVKYSYDANGNRTMMQYPQTNIYTGYRYNRANLVEEVDNYVGTENTNNTSDMVYSYTLDGNISDMQDLDGSANVHRYDTMGRLFEDEDYRLGGYTKEYTFDRFGNRATMMVYNEDYDDQYEITYTYDLNNHLVSESKESFVAPVGVTVTTYTYDANGNQLTQTTVDGTETRSYNGFGQLVSVSSTVPGSAPASYAYRPDGLRYSKTTGAGSSAVTHKHLWDGQNIVAEMGATNTINTRYIRGLNLVARKIDTNLQYYQFNYHGDVQHLLSSTGTVLINYRYDGFGNQLDAVATDTNPFRYCGEYFDRETGTYYLRARNYDPFIGRFITEDPVRSGLNWFIYCDNNPILLTDPSGLLPLLGAPNKGNRTAGDTKKNGMQFLYDEGIDKLYPSNRRGKKNTEPQWGIFGGNRKNFFDAFADYEAYLESGATIPPWMAEIIQQKALISAHGQFPGPNEKVRMFYGDLDVLSAKNGSLDFIDAAAGVGEAQVLGGDKGFYLKVGATQGNANAGVSMRGFKVGAQVSLQRFTLGYKGDGFDLHGNLNLGAIGANINAQNKNIGAEFSYGVGVGIEISWD